MGIHPLVPRIYTPCLFLKDRERERMREKTKNEPAREKTKTEKNSNDKKTQRLSDLFPLQNNTQTHFFLECPETATRERERERERVSERRMKTMKMKNYKQKQKKKNLSLSLFLLLLLSIALLQKNLSKISNLNQSSLVSLPLLSLHVPGSSME